MKRNELGQKFVNDPFTGQINDKNGLACADICIQEAVAFAKFIGFQFFYEDETELWETIPEGKTYDFRGQKQFRFTTEELYELFNTQQ